MNLNYVIGGVAGLALLLSILSLSQPPVVQRIVEQVVGAAAGPEVTQHTIFMESYTDGGRKATSTTATSATLVEENFLNAARLDFSPSVPSITATLPATSTVKRLVPKPGDTHSVLMCNSTSTANRPFTLAAGTGINLAQATGTLAINTDQCARLIFSRQADSDIDVFFDLGY